MQLEAQQTSPPAPVIHTHKPAQTISPDSDNPTLSKARHAVNSGSRTDTNKWPTILGLGAR